MYHSSCIDITLSEVGEQRTKDKKKSSRASVSPALSSDFCLLSSVASDFCPLTSVAIGILLRSNGAYLLARRPANKVYAGFWEFPGGKIEQGESPDQALSRELKEELAITPHHPTPWACCQQQYAHGLLRLYFYLVYRWQGSPTACEGQALHWVTADGTLPSPILPANEWVMRAIRYQRTEDRGQSGNHANA